MSTPSPIAGMTAEQARWCAENHRRNAAGWRAQAARMPPGTEGQDTVLGWAAAAIAEAHAIEDALHRQRRQRRPVRRDEQEPAARLRWADQARRVGQAIGDKEDS